MSQNSANQQEKSANRLIHETSPYLLQHAYNPVDWYPWGEEALSKAEAEGKPILLSVGYSACHWCHVMERESFENQEIADVMNQHFINIKVDREERPDIDHIYQSASQLLSGQGGWPLTVFLTPDQRPFYAGTYFPPDDRYGRPGFLKLLQSLASAFQNEPHRIEQAADRLTKALARLDTGDVTARAPVAPEEGEALLEKAADWLEAHFDEENGGFGSAPKFPNTSSLEFFLRRAARNSDSNERRLVDLVDLALKNMAEGGIYDQLGGGFHRYSVDERWLVPHFEKMLYDNALLPQVYLQGWQWHKDPLYRQIVEETLAYVEREMSHPDGGFYSSQDADSEGVEGKFFVWRPEEIEDVLGEEDGLLICRYFGVTDQGNFEDGTTVLHVAISMEDLARERGLDPKELQVKIEQCKKRLFEAREARIKPSRDDKTLTSWSALMLSTFARAGRIFESPAYVERAEKAAAFIESNLIRGDELLRTYKERPSNIPGYLDDYAYWVQALIDLYEATFNRSYLDQALFWMDRCLQLFWDEKAPGFYLTPVHHERLIHRPKDWRDESLPSGTGICVLNLLRLHHVDEQRGYDERAQSVLENYRRQMDQNPWAASTLLLAYDALVNGGTEVIVVATDDQIDEALSLMKAANQRYVSHPIFHLITPEEAKSDDAPSLWRGKLQKEGRATAYICRGFTCSPPVLDVSSVEETLDSMAK